ncbi:hypothetical protein [Paenibacillus tengchongensis]|uniref:hypothetical protein n=1 Tax=Paenibacillus tengchongensis TaxID=2608684 RepID=UPI00124EA1FC|nr:hypothetical protein [Paenibacillus tengchongensis]
MDTTVCPWCHTEIVWDEEFGPEETCPHCNNELTGYRTITVGPEDLGDEDIEDADDDADEHEAEDAGDDKLWDDEDKEAVVPIFNTVTQFGDDYDPAAYELNVATVLAAQLEAPECPQCHELMVMSGKQPVPSFEPAAPEALNGQLVLEAPFALNLYVCPSCFHVQHSLGQEDRIRFVRNLSGKGKE